MELINIDTRTAGQPENERLFLPDKELLLPPFFRQQVPVDSLNAAKRVCQEEIINRINYCHFNRESVLISLKHPRYNETVLFKALPEPCSKETLTCSWAGEAAIRPESYILEWLIIRDGQSIILVPAEIREMTKKSVCLQITDKGYVFGQRRLKRYTGKNIEAEFTQKGLMARGCLVDFNPEGIRVRVRPDAASSLNWLNPDEKVSITLFKGNEVAISCTGDIYRQSESCLGREIVLKPDLDTLSRFPQKKIRPGRHQLVPSPTVCFEHPLSGSKYQRQVFDISYSGLSVNEPIDDQLLIPGLIIPELTINFAGILKLKCKAQVVCRFQVDDRTMRQGLVFLDMDVPTYNRLTQLISNTQDENNYISTEVDMDALWEFFFETGFIYPKKYKQVESYTDQFKEVYRKLYQESPEISIHYTYQKDGKMYAHLSMLRAYEKAWMLHHHAAKPLSGKRTGFIVLKQMINYVNGIYHLPTPAMEYVFCYFRPDNGFPDMVYGEFAREYNDYRGCSLDLFAYMPFKMSPSPALPGDWALRESSVQDLWELELFYRSHSDAASSGLQGGLMIDAFGLRHDNAGSPLKKLYAKNGFARDWRTFSLLHEGSLKAVFVVNQANLGINLSELLNSVSVIVIEGQGLTWDILSRAINEFAGCYEIDSVPVMIYPFDYAQENNVPFEKQYYLWIFNLHRASQDYLQHLQKRFRLTFG